ncbi:MAG: hypothetical protein JWO37_1260 [Acidimicrobiales bacterium]|jgi:uncharacterized protein YPO0396|nr:hypothetical protein [Acidimicrobiales bacterium]
MSDQDIRLRPEQGPSQWRLESMQLVNWGGFQGFTSIEFSPTSTLISGASGTGKSTILDAWLALMMDSNTPFNGASNDAGRGRARGVTQRGLLTYLRGKLDDIRENGEAGERNLRGSSSWTWGAIAATFVDEVGQRFTTLRLYHAARSAVRDSDVTKKLCTAVERVDLKEFEPLAVDRFDKRAIRSRFPTINVHDSYDAFAVATARRLGIGSGGDGASALRLLARIQAGAPITNIDRLYKELVLEEPATFAAADRAINHFAHLEAAHAEMATAAAKQKALAALPDLWADYESQVEKVNAIDELHLNRPDSPAKRWVAVREAQMATEALLANREEHERQASIFERAKGRDAELKRQVRDLEAAIDEAGGGELKTIDSQLEHLADVLSETEAARREFNDRTIVLNLHISSGEEFAAAKAAADSFVTDGYSSAAGLLTKERSEKEELAFPLRREARDLRTERESLRGREGQVPQDWHAARVEAAQAAGLQLSDLPFVAELIDLRPEHADWRTAAELTFRSVAQVMLVDQHHLGRLSRAIDHFQWKSRINFEGVELRPFVNRQMDPAMLSGKLLYKDSLFTAWVQDRLTSAGTDALCVPTTDALDGPGRRVTTSGQTRDGRRGAHGGSQRPIIGFDSKARLAAIEADLVRIAEQLNRIDTELADIGEREGRLRHSLAAHNVVAAARWASIDHKTIAAQIEDLEERKQTILSASDVLRVLESQKAALESRREEAAAEWVRADDEVKRLDRLHGALEDRVRALTDEIKELDSRGATVADDQATTLRDRFDAIVGEDDYTPEWFAGCLARLIEALDKDRADASRNSDRVAATLHGMFEHYQQRWPDPNLGTDAASAPDYRKILDEITTTGLHERLQEWVRRIAAWTGEDLLPLHVAFDTAIEDITDRLAPVNTILADLPFGANRDRLRIQLRRLTHDKQVKFRLALKTLSSGASGQLTIDQATEKFKELRAFIDLIRPASGSGDKSDRDYHLDVRRHIELSAEVVTVDGTARAEYSTLGGKSGGETQELVAFIIGAALRFQLGEETNDRPTFAPVLLDEGFVKADSEFAGRGVKAWLGLGFQLIVAAPFDKVTALEPHVAQMLQVTKNPLTGHARIDDLIAK